MSNVVKEMLDILKADPKDATSKGSANLQDFLEKNSTLARREKGLVGYSLPKLEGVPFDPDNPKKVETAPEKEARELRNTEAVSAWQAAIDNNLQFSSSLSRSFDEGVTTSKSALDDSLDALSGNSTDPHLLASYQARLAEYTMYRNAQSNTVKGYKDIAANSVRNLA